MLCVADPNDLYVSGNYDSSEAENIVIVFEVCNQETAAEGVTCASETDAKAWMQSKYIVTLQNEKIFIQYKFEKETLQTRAETKWYSLTPLVRTEYVNMIERSMMELDDDYMGFVVNYENGFKIDKQPNRLQWNESFQTSIAFEVSRD